MPTLLQRSARLAPYFKSGKRGFAVAIVALAGRRAHRAGAAGADEAAARQGFGQADIPLWLVPVVIIGLFVVRGAAGFVAQYALAWAANQGVLNLRGAMFDRLLDAHPALFTRHSRQQPDQHPGLRGAAGRQPAGRALLALVRDS